MRGTSARSPAGRRHSFQLSEPPSRQRCKMEVYCPGCQTAGVIDLRDVDFHCDASISVVVRRASCKRCCPNPPFAKIMGLRRGSARWDGR